METELSREARKLLEEKTVDYVVGFTQGSLKYTTTPLITRNKDNTAGLVNNRFINCNLARYLLDLKGRVGIVAKGCDGRSIISLVQDKQVNREDIVIIGIPCSGLIDLGKIEKLTGKDRDLIDNINIADDKAVITIDGKKKGVEARQVLFDHCLSCESPVPPDYDILIEGPVKSIIDQRAGKKAIQDLEKMSPDRRWAFWKDQFKHCIRCYACRQVCPSCFCERCFVEETQPKWVSYVSRWQDNLMFHVVRAMHLAGRCTDCGECERVCPQHIPLRSMMAEMCGLVSEMFNYSAGMDKNALPLMSAYEATEAEELFR